MKRTTVLDRTLLVAAVLALATFAVSATAPVATPSEPLANSFGNDPVSRGHYLVTTSGCHDCHTPFRLGPNGPEPDWTRMLSGHPQDLVMPEPPAIAEGPWLATVAATNTAWAGPWGVSFTANLTPDRETGLGKWSFTNFKDTIRTGRHLGRGRPILPPMPIPMYRNFTDDDLAAIYAYLRTLPPVRNKVPAPRPPAAAPAAAP